MLHVRFTAFVLGLLFVLHAFKSCSVHAHQGEETVGEEAVVSVQKEFLAAFGGRKMGGHEVSEEIGAPKNSGETNNADAQVIGLNKLEPKTSEFADKTVSEEPAVTGNRAESKMLLEAAKEIVNLIHKDYKGADRRKPPINNHVPRH